MLAIIRSYIPSLCVETRECCWIKKIEGLTEMHQCPSNAPFFGGGGGEGRRI